MKPYRPPYLASPRVVPDPARLERKGPPRPRTVCLRAFRSDAGPAQPRLQDRRQRVKTGCRLHASNDSHTSKSLKRPLFRWTDSERRISVHQRHQGVPGHHPYPISSRTRCTSRLRKGEALRHAPPPTPPLFPPPPLRLQWQPVPASSAAPRSASLLQRVVFQPRPVLGPTADTRRR
jgi:hypothetical protein